MNDFYERIKDEHVDQFDDLIESRLRELREQFEEETRIFYFLAKMSSIFQIIAIVCFLLVVVIGAFDQHLNIPMSIYIWLLGIMLISLVLMFVFHPRDNNHS